MSDLSQLLPTTALEAVNGILASIGEQPIQSLIDIEAADAGNALRHLRAKMRSVQEQGWAWNTEEDWVLTPNDAGELTLPANTLKVLVPADCPYDVVQRGLRLYDKKNHTYAFTETVTVTLVVALDFEEMPEAARQYCMLAAAVDFQAGNLGSVTLDRFATRAMTLALQSIEAAEAETGNYNILTGNWAAYRIIQRTTPP